MDPNATFYVKAKQPNAKRFAFVAPGGRLNDLRVHAGRFTKERAIAAVRELRSAYADEPGWVFQARDGNGAVVPVPEDVTPTVAPVSEEN